MDLYLGNKVILACIGDNLEYLNCAHYVNGSLCLGLSYSIAFQTVQNTAVRITVIMEISFFRYVDRQYTG